MGGWVAGWLGGWVGVCVLKPVRSQDPRGRDWPSKHGGPKAAEAQVWQESPSSLTLKADQVHGRQGLRVFSRQRWRVGTRGSCCPSCEGLASNAVAFTFWCRRLTKKPGQEGKIAVVVGSVTDDKRVYEARVPGLGAPFGPLFQFQRSWYLALTAGSSGSRWPRNTTHEE